MVGVFRRSLSFPNKNPNRPLLQKPAISHHIRSISLPCRSHPLISQIKDEINDLTVWASTSKSSPQTSTNLSHGLTLLKDTHETLQDILQLPQTRETLRSHPQWIENLLEDFLRFVDAYGIFQTSTLSLKEEHSSAQMAVRKRDQSKVAVYVKAKKKISKEMKNLVCTVRGVTVTQHQRDSLLPLASIADTEVRRVIVDVMSVTVAVSVALFNGIATSFSSRRMSWARAITRKGVKRDVFEGIEELEEEKEISYGNLKKKGDEEVRTVLKRMRDLEGCICEIQSVSDKLFRALINSRVALLNTLTLTH